MMNNKKKYHITSLILIVILSASSLIQLQAALLSYDHCMNNMQRSDHSMHNKHTMHEFKGTDTHHSDHADDCCLNGESSDDELSFTSFQSENTQIQCICEKDIFADSENAVIVIKLKLPSVTQSIIQTYSNSSNGDDLKQTLVPPLRYTPPLLYLKNESLLI